MNRFSHNLHFSARLGGGATAILVVLLLLLAPSMPALTKALTSKAQGPTPGATDTMTPAPTTAATATAMATGTAISIDDALTATAIVVSTETAEALTAATTTVAANERATLTAVAERSTQAALNDRSTQTAVAFVTGTAEALRLTATVDQQNTATTVALLTVVAERTRAHEATVTAEAANIVPTPEPSATPVSPPAEAPGVLTPEAPPEPEGSGSSIILVVGVVLGLLAAGVLGAFFVLSRRRKQAAVVPMKPTLPPPAVGEQAQGSLLTPHRPQPGVPYLESRNRPSGVLYCPLKKPTIRVGRSTDNDLVLDDSFAGWQTVSRHHATVEYDSSRVVVVAGESPNGVLVQGRRAGENVVRDGWIISFGQVEFVLRDNRKGGAQ